MKISTKGRYALRAVIDLAEHGKGGSLNLREIARRQNLSVKYLETLFTLLVKKGILTSRRGVDGGYALALPPSRISVYDVLSVIEGRMDVVDCLGSATHCLRSGRCRTKSLWKEVSELIRRKFRYTTIADLVGTGK